MNAKQTVHVSFDAEGFDIAGRANVEHAIYVLDKSADDAGTILERVRHENAAATLRELLNPRGAYFSREFDLQDPSNLELRV